MSLSFPKKTEKILIRKQIEFLDSASATNMRSPSLRTPNSAFSQFFVHLWKSRTQFQRMWETPLKQTKGLNAVIFRSETGGEHGRDDRIAFFYYPMSSEISDIYETSDLSLLFNILLLRAKEKLNFNLFVCEQTRSP